MISVQGYGNLRTPKVIDVKPYFIVSLKGTGVSGEKEYWTGLSCQSESLNFTVKKI